MLLALVITLIVVNVAAVALLYVQHRQAARERDATGRIVVEIYNAAHGAVLKSAELTETATAVRAQLEQDRLAVLRMLTALRPLVAVAEEWRGGARS